MVLNTTGKIEKLRGVVDRAGEFRPPANADEQSATNDRLGNFANGVDGTETDDATGGTLPSGSVPEGVEVIVQAQHDNADRIRVGLTSDPAVELAAGQSATYRVEDTGQIHIWSKTAGDGVNYSHEAN